jgi:hypothetical protein
MLTVVALLSFIILGLMATFNQTQRAWKTSMVQTDVLEAGRMATDLVTRDFLSITPSLQPWAINFDSITDNLIVVQDFPQTPPPVETRTNLRERVFFVTQHNKLWRCIGYRVLSPDTGMADAAIGTLYRYETNVTQLDAANLQWTAFHADNPTNASTQLSPIIGGVVHFTVTTYDPNGVLLTTNRLVQLGLYVPPGIPALPLQFQNIFIRSGVTPNNPGWVFRSNAVPAYVDIELGILESKTADQVRAIPTAAAKTQFLQKHLGNVHLFRQRIPIRNVDPEAYQ